MLQHAAHRAGGMLKHALHRMNGYPGPRASMKRAGTICGIILLAAASWGRGEEVFPNDPRLGISWHVEKLGLREAWGHSTGDSSIIAAVLDTGGMSHTPDF